MDEEERKKIVSEIEDKRKELDTLKVRLSELNSQKEAQFEKKQKASKELSELFLFLANNGSNILDNDSILTKSQSKRVNALMQTCGFYDESGEFAFKVGLPGKSGVGGGIVAVHPKQYTIVVWSPKLNKWDSLTN